MGQYHNLIKSYIAIRSEFKVAFYVMSLNSKRVYIYINEFKKMFFFWDERENCCLVY